MPDSRALSQSEIDALLTQIPDGADDEAFADAASAAAQADRGFARVIKTYDFRRPLKFSKEQWHTLQAMHETFARLLGAAFSSRLRTIVTARLSSIDQGLYEEWQSQVPSGTVCYVLAMPPLAGNIVVEFNNEIAGEVVDRLLGGNGLLVDAGRDLGEIELSLLRSFSQAIITSLEQMWSGVLPVEPELKDIGLEPALIQVAGPNDVVITAFFELSIGNKLGAMSICIPYTVLETVAGLLSAQIWHLSGGKPRGGVDGRKVIEALLGEARVELSVQLGAASVPVSAAIEMREGDTLLLDARVDRPLPMFVSGEQRFLCRPGLVGNKIGVRVTEVVEPRDFGLDEADLLAAGIGMTQLNAADVAEQRARAQERQEQQQDDEEPEPAPIEAATANGEESSDA